LLAQQPNARIPHIGYIFPAGVQRGTTCEVAVGGQFLDNAQKAYVSGSGLSVTILKVEKPLPQKRVNELRDYLTEARKKLRESKDPGMAAKLKGMDRNERITEMLTEAGATADEIKAFLKERDQRMDYKRQQNVQIVETGILRIDVAPDALPGAREIRLQTPLGMSNPLAFCVGTLPETRIQAPTGKTIETAPQVNLPNVINGQILPGEVDRFAFKAARGARLVVSVQARDLIPYLADAVPGWFQPIAALYDAKGKEVAYSFHYQFNPDPVFSFEAPESGSYLLEIRDALYRGREDFVYRITVGELPFVTGLFPLGGRTGPPLPVNVSGWNLRPKMAERLAAQVGSPVRLTLPASAEAGIAPVPSLPGVGNGRVVAGPLVARDTLPELGEQEREGPDQPQRVKLPVIVNGKIGVPGEVDVYTFRCSQGEKVVAEVLARRLDSPLDSFLKITGPRGDQVAFNDDWLESGDGYLTHRADSYATFTAKADGVYRVRLGDSQRKGGPQFAYRLRLSSPRPDFALRVAPSSINARPGFSVPVTLYALRQDGFEGDIVCSLKNAPPGFVLDGAWIQAGQDKARATLTFPAEPCQQPIPLVIEGCAKVTGTGSRPGEITRQAAPAEDMLQAFIYHHLVPASELLAVSSGTTRREAPFLLAEKTPLALSSTGGGQARFAFGKAGPKRAADIHLSLSEPSEGITLGKVTDEKGGFSVVLLVDPAKLKPGAAGNVLLEMFNEWTPKGAKPGEKKRGVVGFLPSIPFKVVEIPK
jgi:hypothetical protein